MTLNKRILMMAAAVSLSLQASANHNEHTYKVTVTNITKGISFTPLLAASHKNSVSLFETGEQATQNIINIAEGGDISGLKQLLDESSDVSNTITSEGLLGPGMSVELELIASGRYRQLSLVAMALPTNDTLVALRGKQLPKRRNKSVTYYMRAFDGGSEMNDELCSNIPGPHCGGSPFSPEDEGEGYIYPSPGIHGEADLSRASFDWRGAVAKVTIMRM